MKKTLFSIFFAFLAVFSIFLPTTRFAYAADITEGTVGYYGEDNALIESINYSALVDNFVPYKDFAGDGKTTLWYTSEARTNLFDFKTALDTDVVTGINLYASYVNAQEVTYYKRSSTYVDGTTAGEYEVLETQKVVTGSYITPITAESVEGFVFSHWSTSFNGTKFDSYNTPITSATALYPVYINAEHEVAFYSKGRYIESKMITHGGTVTPPTGVTEPYCEFVGWKVYGDDDANLVDFSTIVVNTDLRYEAVYNVLSAVITIAPSPYFTLQNSVTSPVNRGTSVIVEIKINENYSNYEFTRDDLEISGTYSEISLDYDETNDSYTVIIYGVDSDIYFNTKSLPLNNYKVTLPEVEGISYNITTSSSDYTLDNGVYTLNVNKRFTFKVEVQEGYYAKAISFAQCTINGDTYTLTNNHSVDITSNCDVVKYYTLTIVGGNNANINMEDNYLQILESKYKFEEGEVATFTATGKTNYFIKSITGANSAGGVYSLTLDSDKTITFDVVEYRTITIPLTTGIENIIVASCLEQVAQTYKIEKGTGITFTYNISASYSQSEVTITCGALTVIEGDGICTINNVTDNATVVFEGLNLNNYVATLISNDMADLTSGGLTSASVDHGSPVVIDYVLEDAYSASTLVKENVIVEGTYTDIIVDSSTITITVVTTDIRVRISGLTKNAYTLSATSNSYGTFEIENSNFLHDQVLEISPVFETMYNKCILTNANVTVTGTYDSIAIINNKLTIYSPQSDITVTLKDLSLNTYLVKLPIPVDGEFLLSTISTNVEHGSDFEFTLTITEAFTQNQESFVLYRNGAVLEGTNNGLVYTFNVQNVTEETILTTTEFIRNVYRVDFIDTSVEPNPTVSVNIVNHGDTIDIISGNKEGYVFDGWYEDEEFTNLFNFTTGITKDTQIYGKYTIRKYSLEFKVDGVTIDLITANFGDKPEDVAPAIPIKEGYTQLPAYWDFETAGLTHIVDKSAIINAIYTINKYTVTFKSVHAGVLSTQMVNHGQDAVAPTNLEVEGYTFDMWDNVFTNVTKDITVNALYNINSYLVVFINGNETDPTKEIVYNQSVVYNETVQRPLDSSIVTVDKCINGWYTDRAMTEEYDFNKSVKENITLYGDIDIKMLRLRFVADGNVVKEVQLAYDTNYTDVLPTIPEKEGYTIVGWSQTSIEGITTDLDIVATYAIKTYTVTFKYQDGSEDTVTVNHGATITELPAKGQGFGKKLVADMNLLKNITSDVTVEISIKDYNTLIFVACGVLAVALIVIVIVLSVRVKTNSTMIKENDAKEKKETK